jgi:tungstate transport system ATP-binding protein
MSGHLVRIDGVSKRFGERVVLSAVAARFLSGESYVLTGDNGSGKSTLMRILAGLDPAESGTLEMDGRTADLASYPEWLRGEIVYVHQHPYLFDTSIAENIGFGLRARGMEAAERRRIVAEALEWAGLGHIARVRPSKLSGGEKQRVAMARAKVLHPRLFLLDEPTANLDRDGRHRVLDLIHDLGQGENCVVVACHDQELIQLPFMRQFRLDSGHLAFVLRPGAKPVSADRTLA